QIKYEDQDGPEIDDLFIDAQNGEVLGRHPQVFRAEIRNIYNANNGTSTPGTFMFGTQTSPPYLFVPPNTAQQNDQSAMNAYNFSDTTYRFYSSVFGRDSWDNRGAVMTATVHYGSNLNNAFFNGGDPVFGDGDGVTWGSFASGLDIVAHEWTHGVTQSTANLNYS